MSSNSRRNLLAPNPKVVPLKTGTEGNPNVADSTANDELLARIKELEAKAREAERDQARIQEKAEAARKKAQQEQARLMEQAEAERLRAEEAMRARGVAAATQRDPRARKRDGENVSRCTLYLPTSWIKPLKEYAEDNYKTRNQIIEETLREKLGHILPPPPEAAE